ncbi:hypothetical protein [Novosphingobium sp. ST904]|nr:hypothetical protein [Novosphingobium sp. ST904]KPH67539.1 hypothetical protein ADT71_02235 [Novosphingobium sp. ST904]
MDILNEGNRLSLTLSLNCTLALAKRGILLRSQTEHCAAEMEAFAHQIEENAGDDVLPPRLAQELHSVAAILRQMEAPDEW